MSSNPCITAVETLKRHTRAVYYGYVAGESPWAMAWTAAYGLYADSACVMKSVACAFALCTHISITLIINLRLVSD